MVGRLVEGDSGFDEATRNHIRNMDVYLARMLDETVQGRSQMTHELRSEIKMVARTIAAVARASRAPCRGRLRGPLAPRAASVRRHLAGLRRRPVDAAPGHHLPARGVRARPVLPQPAAAGQGHPACSLERAIAELTAELDIEQATSAELRLSVTQLSSDLQAAIADRDDTAALLAETEAERDEFRDRVFALEDQQAALTQTLNELRAGGGAPRGRRGRARADDRSARPARAGAGAGPADDRRRQGDDRGCSWRS